MSHKGSQHVRLTRPQKALRPNHYVIIAHSSIVKLVVHNLEKGNFLLHIPLYGVNIDV